MFFQLKIIRDGKFPVNWVANLRLEQFITTWNFMNKRNAWKFFLIASLITSISSSATEMSDAKIQRWINKSEGKIELSNITKIQLESGEVAYLASAEFPERGRNFMAGYILARPTQGKAIVLPDYGGQFNKISIIRNYGTSVLVIGAAGSGQGNVDEALDVVTFNGWGIRKLHSVKTSSNLGSCGIDLQLGSGEICESTDVFLNPLSSINSTTVFVAETLVSHKGKNSESLKSTIKSRVLEFRVK